MNEHRAAGRSDLRSTQFRREREESWRELERILDALERRGIRNLSAEQIGRLPGLYHSAISSLSVARAISLDKNLLDYLENLAGRAYLAVYGTKRSAIDAAREFLVRGFPESVRRFRRQLAVSGLVLCLGAASGFALVASDEGRYYSLISEEMHQGRTPDASTESLRAVLYHDDEEGHEESLNAFASYLFTRNAKVGILCFALGFAAGAPVIFLLFYNGLILGAMAALYAGRSLGTDFWAWVLPHGVTELLAVCLCGMAGLVIGNALVFPGRHGRLHRLAVRGREAATIVIGAVGMFLIAGLIEGFFRQLVDDVPTRWLVAAVSAVFWLAYFGLAGRRR